MADIDERAWTPPRRDGGMTTLRAQVRRRLLVSYRIDPELARTLVPAPFRPQLVDGSAVGGVCVIGLTSVRPGWVRPRIGVRSENVAHRIAVEWDEPGGARSGVYILERHSAALLPVVAGGRLFPGVQRRARVALDESDERYRIRMRSASTSIDLDVDAGGEWRSSLFPTVHDASEFHRRGSIGWSPTRDGSAAEALELTSPDWAVHPAHARRIRSSFFDALPPGSAELDSVVLMRDLLFLWETPRPRMPLAVRPATRAAAVGT